ncbi:MAG: di-heme enzyme [Kofleriaceae bacterium]
MLACAVAACGDDVAPPAWQWDLPAGFPVPVVPVDNPMSAAKVELGRHLFYDRRLSINTTMSCATCHLPEQAFADGKIVPEGATGEFLARNSPGLQNVAYLAPYTWANPTLGTLEAQVVVPMFGDRPIELGTGEDLQGILARLAAEPRYPPLFAAAFPHDTQPIHRASIISAIASFMRSLIRGGSPADRERAGNTNGALSESALRGKALFFSERTHCSRCHGGLNFTVATSTDEPRDAPVYANNGLYNVGNAGRYPSDNPGLAAITGQPGDDGKFRVPPLRNLTLTAPYMHDGSVATLEDVVDNYARGGRVLVDGPLAGDGALHPNKSPLVAGFALTAQEREGLLAWLRSLTDEGFGGDPRFADPWTTR